MSESKELAAIGSTQIMSHVDMKLSKQDIIDLVVEERRVQLQEAFETACEAQNNLQGQLEAFRRQTQESVKKALLSNNKKIIKAFKATFPNAKENFHIRVDHSFQDRMHCEKNPQRYGEWNEESGRRSLLCIGAELQMWSDDKRHDGASLTLRTLPEGFFKEKRAEAEALYQAFVENERLREQLEEETADLTKRGSRVKAELTKKILEQSEQGKALLGAVDKLRKSIKL